MRKTKEIPRLRFELGLGQRQIARSCGMELGTVHDYLERAVAAGISWPLPEDLREQELEARLFGKQPVEAQAVRSRPQPDWKTIHEQLQQYRHLTLQLVWEEYRQANPDGYRYSWFCERYQHWRQHLDGVLRQEHKAGEKMFVAPTSQTPTSRSRPRKSCPGLTSELPMIRQNLQDAEVVGFSSIITSQP
jgi:hypothetical protein